MPIVRVSLGMTLSLNPKATKSFEFFRPEISWEIDTDKPLEPQFEINMEVTKQTWKQMADLLEVHIREELSDR